MPLLTDQLIKPLPPAHEKLRLFSLYVDFSASVCARWAACAIGRLAEPDWQTTSEMWKLDSSRASAPIRRMMIDDAAAADVIIVAASSLAQPEPALFQWLDSLAALKTAAPAAGLLLGLLGDEETQSVELAATVQPLIRCAQSAGRDFIWHWMGENAMSDSEWLVEHIKDLLSRKLAGFHETAVLASRHF